MLEIVETLLKAFYEPDAENDDSMTELYVHARMPWDDGTDRVTRLRYSVVRFDLPDGTMQVEVNVVAQCDEDFTPLPNHPWVFVDEPAWEKYLPEQVQEAVAAFPVGALPELRTTEAHDREIAELYALAQLGDSFSRHCERP